MTRYDVLNDHVMGSRFRLWDLKADARPIEQLTALAELHAGRRLDDAGRVVPLTLDDYRRRWQGVVRRHPEWFADQARELAEDGSRPARACAETARRRSTAAAPAQTPDYAAVFKRFGGADRPPLLSLAAALQDQNENVRLRGPGRRL